MIIVNDVEPLTIITNCSFLDVVAVLDPPLVPQHASEGIYPLSIYLALRKKCPYSELFWSGFFPHSGSYKTSMMELFCEICANWSRNFLSDCKI